MNSGNEILEEIWKARQEIEQENGHDMEAIYKNYLRKQSEHPSDYYSGKPVKVKKTGATSSR
jgi:hypothetical protein